MHNISVGERITEHMPVFCADGHDHGLVDGIEGDYIKLTKDDEGQHHWLPLSLVTDVDEVVRLSSNHEDTLAQTLSEDPNA